MWRHFLELFIIKYFWWIVYLYCRICFRRRNPRRLQSSPKCLHHLKKKTIRRYCGLACQKAPECALAGLDQWKSTNLRSHRKQLLPSGNFGRSRTQFRQSWSRGALIKFFKPMRFFYFTHSRARRLPTARRCCCLLSRACRTRITQKEDLRVGERRRCCCADAHGCLPKKREQPDSQNLNHPRSCRQLENFCYNFKVFQNLHCWARE